MSHIVIDARIINSSTGHYVEYLLHHLQKIDILNRYTVLIPSKDKDFWKPTSDNFSVQFADQKPYSFSEQLSFTYQLYRLKPDLVHFTMPQQPVLYFGKHVTTIHDTTLVRYENIKGNKYVYKLKKSIFISLLRNVLRSSKAIFTPTEYVRNDLIKFSNNNYSDKIHTTLLAGEVIGAIPEAIASLKNKDFIFFVGNAFPYKNLQLLVDAYKKIKQDHPKLTLVFAGKPDQFHETLQAYTLDQEVDDVLFLGYISDGEKRWLFQHAKSYVVPSLSEGFHMPLLEAMEDNCPVISSTATCMPEVAADAALYFDPYSSDELARQLQKLLASESLRQDLIKKGKKRAAEFSWTDTAKKTHAVYTSIL